MSPWILFVGLLVGGGNGLTACSGSRGTHLLKGAGGSTLAGGGGKDTSDAGNDRRPPASGGSETGRGPDGGNVGGVGVSSGAAGGLTSGVSAPAGRPSTGGGGGPGGVSGTGSGTADVSDYTACEYLGNATTENVYRIDRENATCTIFGISKGLGGCALGLTNNGYCLSGVSQSADLANCAQGRVIAGAIVPATRVTGTFAVTSGSPPVIDIDLTAQFPKSAGLLQTVHALVSGCKANCAAKDCRQ